MNPGGLTDDELLRLARLLQQTRGEGLAFINPGEAQMLKDAGGSGQPISGTQGFGVGGGPIRSYDSDTQGTGGTSLKDAYSSGTTSSNTTGGTFSTGGGTTGSGMDSGSKDKMWHEGTGKMVTYNQYIELEAAAAAGTNTVVTTTPGSQGFDTDAPSSTKPPEGWTKQGNGNIVKTVGTTMVTGVPNTYGGYTFITSGPENIAGANTTQEVEAMVLQQQGGSQQGDQGGQGGKGKKKKQFFDEFGNSYTSQALADAANAEISQQRYSFTDFIKGHILTDTDLETLKLGLVPPEIHKLKDRRGNPIDLTFKEYMSSVYPNLPDSELEKIFNEQKSLILKTAGPQIKQFTDKISQILQNKTETIDGVVTTIPRTQGELESLVFDDIASELAGEGNLLSEDTKRSIFQTMLNTAVRTQRFTLTPEEVAQFATDAIIVDETGITDATAPTVTDPGDTTAPTVGTISDVGATTIGAYGDAVAPTLGTVDDAVAPTIGPYDDADVSAADVDEITVQDPTLVAAIGDMDETFLAEVRDGENELKDILKKRISGEATSPAELQLKRSTEDNLRLLLSTSAGVMDPAKLRQVRNLYSETSQVLSGQAAELRSKEQIDAEERLVRLYEQQGTRELNIAMGNLEKDKQIAIKNADYESAAKLAIMQAETQRVITKATLKQGIEIANLKERAATAREQGNIDLAVELENAVTDRALVLAQGKIDSDTEIANLRERAQTAREQGNIDLATKLQNSANERAEVIAQAEADTAVVLANLENAREVAIANMTKDVTLATTNAELALRSKALDNAIALASFEGQMALEGLETKVELTELELDVKEALATLGYETQEKIANLNAQTQIAIAKINASAAKYKQGSDERNALIGAIGLIISKVVA